MILTYLEYLSNAFIIDRVNRYDIHGKRLFELGDKFYFEDLVLFILSTVLNKISTFLFNTNDILNIFCIFASVKSNRLKRNENNYQ